MNDAFDQLESQLRQAVRFRRRKRLEWVRRGHARTWAIAIITMLVMAGGALAAGGVIRIGGSTHMRDPTHAQARSGDSPPAGVSSSSAARAEAVVYVAGRPISKASYEHWLAVERAIGGANNLSHRVLAFLITSSWMLGEGSARHISISQAEAQKRLRELKRRDFPKQGQLQRYLTSSKQTTGDFLSRVRVELIKQRIAREVAGTASGTSAREKLVSFQQSFHDHWKLLTVCLPGYVMEDCKQYRGGPEAALSQPSRSTSAAPAAAAGSDATHFNGKFYTAPGAFSISSPAFELNGAIPATYTCDGAGISPPLSWQKVPAHAAELVLFVIDDSAAGADGGVRWIVGGIDPASSGVAEGKLPQGTIVGTNSAGKASYSPICPAPGHTDTIEFVLYALKKPIALSPGFGPAVAEQEYGASNDILGRAAVIEAVYHRP